MALVQIDNYKTYLVDVLDTTGLLVKSGVGAMVDGVALVAGMLILCTGETTLSDNGVYIVRAGAWDRTFPKEEGRPNVYIERGLTHQFEWWHAHEEDWSTGDSTWEKS